MQNNSGFTLVELLMTISILGLIVAIAVPSYNKVSDVIRENQRNNIIKRIEIAASRYAYDTGKTIIFVDELITEGYLDSDDESDNLKDPVNNERLNCYIVEMTKKNNYYNATFVDNKNFDVSGKCDINKLQEAKDDVYIEVSNTISTYNDFIKGENIVLTAHSNNTVNIDCEENDCVFTSSNGAVVKGVNTVSLSNVHALLETKYTFQYTVFDDESSQIKRYTATKNLKIDNEGPIIYTDQTHVTNRYVDSVSKKVTIYASDNLGSGIAGYFLKIVDDDVLCSSSSIENQFQESNQFTVSTEGTYLLCVKDNLGNVSASRISLNHFVR